MIKEACRKEENAVGNSEKRMISAGELQYKIFSKGLCKTHIYFVNRHMLRIRNITGTVLETRNIISCTDVYAHRSPITIIKIKLSVNHYKSKHFFKSFMYSEMSILSVPQYTEFSRQI